MRRDILSVLCLVFATITVVASVAQVSSVVIVLYDRRGVVTGITGDANALLDIQELQATIPQESGTLDILSIRNNLPEVAVVEVYASLGFLTDLQVSPNVLPSSGECVVTIYYDTGSVAAGDYPLDLTIVATSERATIALHRSVVITVEGP